MSRPWLPNGVKGADLAATLLRWALAARFIQMGLVKGLDPAHFLKLADQYGVAGNYFQLNAIAVTMPWLEVFCGILLLTGVAVRGVSLVLASLLAVFTALVWHRALGLEAAQHIPFCAVEFDCGCGGGAEHICAKLPENIVMLLISLWLLAGRGRAFCWRHSLWPSTPAPDLALKSGTPRVG